jgi:pimeloyl-ACP methyl ester carboxylesterase
MLKLQTLAAMAVGVLTATLGGFEAHAQTAAPVEARNVVLIHGAWADGSSWAEVIPRLQAAGLKVTAVQNPLTTLADSVAATRRALALQDGPTVLVAHSWGGTVLSEVGTDPKVTALVYVAARAPEPPPLCSANEPRRPPGTPNHHGMRCRNSTRRSIPTWSDFSQSA